MEGRQIELPSVSIVMVGHNEAKNLQNALEAINQMSYPRESIELIYIDSNSTDDSVEIATTYADKMYSIKSKWSTAGEAFNKGIALSTHDIVHITGGDIILDPQYLEIAVSTLIQRDDTVAVTGYFEETNNEGWNKIIGYRRQEDIDTSDHFVSAPNGGTFKKEAFYVVDGYDERIKKGQETELGHRLNEEGMRILYKHIRQGFHDFDIPNIFAMIKRFANDGKSLAYLVILHAREPNNDVVASFYRSGRRLLMIYSFLLLITIVIAVFKPIFFAFPLLLYWVLTMIRIRCKKRKMTKEYRLYCYVSTLGGFFTYFGMLSFFVRYILSKLKGYDYVTPRKGLSKCDL